MDLLDTADWLGVPAIALGELWLGFLLGGRFEKNVADLEEFLANSAVHELAVDRSVVQIYAEIVAALRKSGHPLPTNDIWIAATAARAGAAVITYDEHFRAIERVGTVLLPAGASG